MKNIDATVIVPTFNSEKSIAQCLESIFSQENVDFEVVVVDGVSKDKTLNVVQRFMGPNIVVISEEDSGIYDAINKGISIAKGNMIGVLGSDDVYAPGSLSVVKKHFNENVGIIGGLTEVDGEIRKDEPYGVAALISGIPFGHNAMFASRKTYEKVGLYDTNYRICADAQWVHRAIKAGVRCLKINEVFVYFGGYGVSSTNPEEIMDESCRVIQENFPFLSIDEARYLLYSYRKWGDSNDIYNMYCKYRKYSYFIQTLSEAFPHHKSSKRNVILEKIMQILGAVQK